MLLYRFTVRNLYISHLNSNIFMDTTLKQKYGWKVLTIFLNCKGVNHMPCESQVANERIREYGAETSYLRQCKSWENENMKLSFTNVKECKDPAQREHIGGIRELCFAMHIVVEPCRKISSCWVRGHVSAAHSIADLIHASYIRALWLRSMPLLLRRLLSSLHLRPHHPHH